MCLCAYFSANQHVLSLILNIAFFHEFWSVFNLFEQIFDFPVKNSVSTMILSPRD